MYHCLDAVGPFEKFSCNQKKVEINLRIIRYDPFLEYGGLVKVLVFLGELASVGPIPWRRGFRDTAKIHTVILNRAISAAVACKIRLVSSLTMKSGSEPGQRFGSARISRWRED